MALINLLPSTLKKPKTEKKTKTAAAASSTSITTIAALPQIKLGFTVFSLISFSIWIFFFLQVKIKQNIITSLSNQSGNYKKTSKELVELTKKRDAINDSYVFYKNIFTKNPAWTEKLHLISNILPDEIWLTRMYTEVKPNKGLIIKGSATSLIESEIINAISDFAANLRKDDFFGDVKLGALIAEKKEKVNIMNFTLNCRLKAD